MLGKVKLYEEKLCIFVIVFWLVLSCFHNTLSRTVTATCCIYAEVEVKCNSKGILGPLN